MNDTNYSNFGGLQGGLDFKFPKGKSCIIKVVGVGGGGGNAVNHMYEEGIHDVSFALCNTDSQALGDSSIPVKIQLGNDGLGAGNKPEKARQAAEDSVEQLKNLFNDGTRMVFITAGMGGGTGTGAAPVVARVAKEMNILTVGIVTIPFKFEGINKINKALDGVDEMAKHVDALLVVNNERLRKVYPSLTVMNAFAKADDTLSVAAKSIADIITHRGHMNLDFEDVKTVLENGGVALMSTGEGEGENRLTTAIQAALNSPLLSNNNIYNAKQILLSISFSDKQEDYQLKMEEMNEVNEFMEKFQQNVNTKYGLFVDPDLNEKVKVTILATGFDLNSINDPELNRHQKELTEDEKEKLDQQQTRYGTYYDNGDDGSPSKQKYNIFYFSDEDLCNEDVISSVEATPTYNRTREEIKKIQQKNVIKED